MAYLPEATTRVSVPSPIAALGVVAARLKRAYVRRAHRHEVAGLLTLEEHMLRDMGVNRDDVREALTHRDPSLHLARIARRRG